MNGFGSYHFANLSGNESLIAEIRQLEQKLQNETGTDIKLIAFSSTTGGGSANLREER